VAELERNLGVPVVTSAQALMWAGLLLAGVREPVSGFGKLFDVHEIDY
jgi:maleate cis-trans isomerase